MAGIFHKRENINIEERNAGLIVTNHEITLNNCMLW